MSNKYLTNAQVVAELRLLVKPYIGIMEQSVFSNYCSRIEKDLCKPATVVNFFKKFGYEGKWDNFKKSE